MDVETLQVDREAGVVTGTLNRPERKNAAGGVLWQEFLGWVGGVGRRPLRRVLMEARVPRSQRQRYPVVARGETILWVPGICRSAAEVPRPGTRAVRLDVTGD